MIYFTAEFGCLFKLAKKEEGKMIYVLDIEDLINVSEYFGTNKILKILNEKLLNNNVMIISHTKQENNFVFYDIYIKNYKIRIRFLFKSKDINEINVCNIFIYRGFIYPIIDSEIDFYSLSKELGIRKEQDLFVLKDKDKNKFFNTIIEYYNEYLNKYKWKKYY